MAIVLLLLVEGGGCYCAVLDPIIHTIIIRHTHYNTIDSVCLVAVSSALQQWVILKLKISLTHKVG